MDSNNMENDDGFVPSKSQFEVNNNVRQSTLSASPIRQNGFLQARNKLSSVPGRFPKDFGQNDDLANNLSASPPNSGYEDFSTSDEIMRDFCNDGDDELREARAKSGYGAAAMTPPRTAGKKRQSLFVSDDEVTPEPVAHRHQRGKSSLETASRGSCSSTPKFKMPKAYNHSSGPIDLTNEDDTRPSKTQKFHYPELSVAPRRTKDRHMSSTAMSNNILESIEPSPYKLSSSKQYPYHPTPKQPFADSLQLNNHKHNANKSQSVFDDDYFMNESDRRRSAAANRSPTLSGDRPPQKFQQHSNTSPADINNLTAALEKALSDITKQFASQTRLMRDMATRLNEKEAEINHLHERIRSENTKLAEATNKRIDAVERKLERKIQEQIDSNDEMVRLKDPNPTRGGAYGGTPFMNPKDQKKSLFSGLVPSSQNQQAKWDRISGIRDR